VARRKKVNRAVNMAVTAAREREQDGKGRNDIVLVEDGREIQEVEGKIAIVTMLFINKVNAMSVHVSNGNAGTSGTTGTTHHPSRYQVLILPPLHGCLL